MMAKQKPMDSAKVKRRGSLMDSLMDLQMLRETVKVIPMVKLKEKQKPKVIQRGMH